MFVKYTIFGRLGGKVFLQKHYKGNTVEIGGIPYNKMGEAVFIMDCTEDELKHQEALLKKKYRNAIAFMESKYTVGKFGILSNKPNVKDHVRIVGSVGTELIYNRTEDKITISLMQGCSTAKRLTISNLSNLSRENIEKAYRNFRSEVIRDFTPDKGVEDVLSYNILEIPEFQVSEEDFSKFF